MGVYEDYVYSYQDLIDAYESSGEADYEEYVDNNSDLAEAYENSGTNNFTAYVNSYPDLKKAYKDSGTKKSKEEWGKAHWKKSGQSEGRTVPKEYSQSKAEWGQDHWQKYGEKEGRELPVYQTQTAEEWGANHWQNNGKNEDRILGGQKLGIDANGKVYLSDTSTIGKGALTYYEGLVNSVNNAQEGSYKPLMEGLEKALGESKFYDLVNNSGIDIISASYQKKLKAWDSSAGAQPPTGSFDPSYYSSYTDSGLNADAEWNNATESVNIGGEYYPDLDITGRFSYDTYMHWHYTTQGKAAGERGNEASVAELPEYYEEYLTDAEYQTYRDKVLGIEGDTILSKQVGTELAAKEKQLQQQFGSLTNDTLKKAADELVKAKAKERDLDFYKSLEGFDEVFSINETITNSLLGDSGIGGILGFVTNPEKAKESLESSLSKATGVPSLNSATYNWEKWFDEQLAGNYEEGIEVTDPLDPTKTYKLDADFAKRYIENYLKPRFDNSKSMSEFISTIDLQQQDKNIFDTQVGMKKLEEIADVRAKAYLDGIYSSSPLNFDANFYWNPEGNFSEDDPKVQKYATQKQEVADDWETAKKNGSSLVPGTDWSWDQWAYHYGLNINDKNEFAKLHYQVKGAASGFDPAKDVITLKDAEDYINKSILPEIAEKDIDLLDVNFLQFVTPEEFADSVIEGVSPETNKEEWDKMLETLGIAGEGMGVDEVKQYITDQFRTGNAINVRQAVKYLNEKGITPTQKKIGVDYIQREEDDTPSTSPYATSLYKIFKNAGYQGNEDDFYNKFMTDVSKEEMQLLEQSSSEKGLQLGGKYAGLTSDDPFSALGSLTSLFGSSDTGSDKDKKKSSYFKLLEDEDTEDYKSKSGQTILGEFTSIFKGFT